MKISRRKALTALASTASAAAFPRAAALAATRNDWFDDAIVVDALGRMGDPYAEEGVTRFTERGWKESLETGVTVLRTTIFPVGNPDNAWEVYRESVADHHDVFGANPDRLALIKTGKDIIHAKRDGKLGVILGTQDTSMIGAELDRMATLREDGLRTVQLTYNNRNLAGDGAIEPANAGLSKLGHATIEAAEAEKLLLDLSHGGAQTMHDAAQAAKRPLTISHTGARALADHPRNVSDELIRKVADGGGVIGVYFMPYIVADMEPSASDVIAHIEHIANVGGEDAVGIGTDNGILPLPFDDEMKAALDAMQQDRLDKGIAAPGEKIGFYPLVQEYNSIDRYRRLVRDLEARGWSQTRLEKLMGTNFLRLYTEVWGG